MWERWPGGACRTGSHRTPPNRQFPDEIVDSLACILAACSPSYPGGSLWMPLPLGALSMARSYSREMFLCPSELGKCFGRVPIGDNRDLSAVLIILPRGCFMALARLGALLSLCRSKRLSCAMNPSSVWMGITTALFWLPLCPLLIL